MTPTHVHVSFALALAASSPMAAADVRVDVSQAGRYEFVAGTGSVAVSLPALPSSSGPGSAFADEVHGVLRAAAATVVDSTAASARLAGEVQFVVERPAPVTAYLHTWLTGALAVEPGAVAGGGIELQSIQRAENSFTYRSSYLLSEGCGPPQQPWFTCTEGRAVAEQVSLAITLQPGEQSVFLQAWLRVSAAQRLSTANFGHSAYVWLEVPEGVSWTSATPGFLSLASPVPEPASTTLGAGGLALLAWRQRQRRHAATGLWLMVAHASCQGGAKKVLEPSKWRRRSVRPTVPAVESASRSRR